MTIDELLRRARRAHDSIHGDPAAALTRAFEAGDALLAAKAQLPHGAWRAALAATGIPSSTARLYMQLARDRERILAAGCTSIREARRLLAGTRPQSTTTSTSARGRRPPRSDRYDEGYADGYRRGRADRSAGARPRTRQQGADLASLDSRDLRWLITLAHPDRHQGDLRATRVTQVLTALRQ